MLILTLHKKFLSDIIFLSTNDSHQPNEVRKIPNGNAQEFFKVQYVLPISLLCDEVSIQLIFITGQMIVPVICTNMAETVDKRKSHCHKDYTILRINFLEMDVNSYFYF